MSARRKLFFNKNVYDIEGTNGLFLNAVREVTDWHFEKCGDYRSILQRKEFLPDMLKSYADLHVLPPIPTLYLKSHQLLSIPGEQMRLKSTTSGTSGKPVEVGMDAGAVPLGLSMLGKMLSYHKLFSLRPVNYLILGYQPSEHNKMGAVRTAYGATFLAPALHREYALKDVGGDYRLNMDGVRDALSRYSRGKSPVRILGFPAYFYFLLKRLEQEDIRLSLPAESIVMLGGGWKQFASRAVDKKELYALAQERLGIGEDQFMEFFGVVEHNIPHFTCRNHHFHIPIYSRVIIRDVRTMAPLGYNAPGLLNLITPFLRSMPMTSIITDDIAVLHEGRECGCGNTAPYFEVLGRAGLRGIKTCAAGAGELLEWS